MVAIRGSFPLQELGRITAEFVTAAGQAPGVERGDSSATPWLSALARGDSLPTRVVAVRSVGRPSLGGGAVEGGRRTLSDTDRADALRLWPDGRITVTAGAVKLLHATSDVGWTDGEWLMSYVPLARGGHRVECYEGEKLVRTWAVPVAPPHVYAGPFVQAEASSPTGGCAVPHAAARTRRPRASTAIRHAEQRAGAVD